MRGIIILTLALQICGSLANYLYNRDPFIDDIERSEYSNEIATGLYQKIAKYEKGNFVFSPVSVSILLSMLYMGSYGKTREQLIKILQLRNSWIPQHAFVKAFLDKLNGFSSVDLILANRIFISHLVDFYDKLNSVTKFFLHASTQTVDFSDGPNASELINKWCAKHTNSKIKNIVSPDDFNSDTAMMPLNAAYFKGTWAAQFDKSKTRNRRFQLEDGTFKNVTTMSRTGFYRVGFLPHLQAIFVKIPYQDADKNDDLSMFILVPTNRLGLRDLENNLSKLNLEDLQNNTIQQITLYLPKFEIESEIDLRAPLNDLGLTKICSQKPDFLTLVTTGGVVVSKIAQKALLEVNEEGSEAAALTQIRFDNGFGADTFIVDQPFLSLIAINRSILFMSRIDEP